MRRPISTQEAPARPLYRRVMTPTLSKALAAVFGLFALLVVDSAYLLGVRILEAVTGQTYQNWLYLVLFLAHLVLGIALIVPFLIFVVAHARRGHDRPNRPAVRVGWALAATGLVLIVSGLVLTRIEGVFEVRDPAVRSVAWWLHVVTPVIAGWLFVLHRLAGKRIRWQVGLRWAAVAAIFAGGMVLLQAQDPRHWNVAGPKEGERYFFPSLARTATGDFIPARVLDNDQYCAECHEDAHARWERSVHKFSSFNNEPYLFSVRETRAATFARDGDVRAARFCAGCHDPVPFFAGVFDDPVFDAVDFQPEDHPTAESGITCTSCHAITNINSVRGNADYTIEEPVHYPFTFSDSEALRWVNRQLVKAKPELHKKTFLKPLHMSPEFCGTCHKVHLPRELNDYKWLRGQNHYDSFLLSGVSGHGVSSFYYPERAEPNCNDCHMELIESDDFGAQDYDDDGVREIHDHLFPSANTAIPWLEGMPHWVVEAHAAFNEGRMRVDLFGIKPGGTLEAPLIAPLRPHVPALEPGRAYLLEVVVRTLGLGHHFTQGTTDSNQVWLEVTVEAGGRVLGKSGGRGEAGEVDPWSHFLNVYMLDREGNRIDRRNAQDIFVPLYDHQIPPGAGDVTHYRIELPEGIEGPVTVSVELRYRKFDTTYMRYVLGDPDRVNDLPVLTLARDRVVFPVEGSGAEQRRLAAEASLPPPEPLWQRWNDYGIGLLRKAAGTSRGELAGAEAAFREVEALGRPEGPLNLARVYLAQGTVEEKAVAALERAAAFDPPADPWSVAWFTGLVDKQNNYLDEAIAAFRSIVEADDAETRERGFDFSKDYRLLNELGQTLFERAKRERGGARRAEREEYLREAASWFGKSLELDPENVTAHYNLALVHRQLGDAEAAARHLEAWQRYRPDDNARDRAIAAARAADPAADHAADAIVLYDLQRPGAFELGDRIEPDRGADPGVTVETADTRASESRRVGG